MKDYQQYLTFVEEGFQPQQSYMFAHLHIIHSCANIIHNNIMFYYYICTFVEEGIQPQHSFMFSYVALWNSPKAADSVCHDKVFDILVIT